ncbi:MAG: sulfatase-like hydrolase/transferase, partial [Bacteroidota bacterium]
MTKLRILYTFFVLIWGCKEYQNEQTDKKGLPNFIIIYTDDQRYDAIGVNGNKIIMTPNLDRMAKKALRFSDAHVAFSLCSPSRAALLTGRYGSANGVLGLGSALKNGEKTLADYLRKAGYVTALSGKWHIKQAPEKLGFDFYSYFRGNGTYYGRRVINMKDTVHPEMHVDKYGVLKSIEFLELQEDSDKPFFLFHCPQTPHMNGELMWDAKDSTKQLYNVSNMPVPRNRLDDLESKAPYLKNVRNLTQATKYGYPDSLAIQSHVRDYYAVITELDHFLGILFDKVEELGLLESTYIIFMSDNGWMLGDHGFTSKVLPYQPSSQVPFWILGPNVGSGINHSMVSNLDVFSTIMELANLEVPENIHGKPLDRILNGEEEMVRDYFIYEGLGV